MQNLLKELEQVLAEDQSLISDGKILKNAVVERALKVDGALIKLLIKSPTIKDHFFQEVGGALVFDKVKFQEFVSNKQFLPDSFTAFKNKIGLTDGDSYLKENKDVVLAWAYKDCVLEGGMTKEDQGQDEIFYNTTLAPDDITRLFEPKVMTKFEKWDADAVKKNKSSKVEAISDTDNLLIKGNNLLALHSLKTRYAGKVKLIYIDPPYNTGDDSFRYNDNFNHSTWLTFIKNRIEISKQLLANDGVIFISLDDTESHYCKIILDEVFGRDSFIANIVYERSGSAGLGQSGAIVNTAEHILAYRKGGCEFYDVNSYLPLEEKTMKRYKNVLASEGTKELVKEFKSKSNSLPIKIFKHTDFKIEKISLANFSQRKEEINEAFIKNFNSIFRTNNVQKENKFQNELMAEMDKQSLYTVEYTPSRGKYKDVDTTLYYYNSELFAWLKDTAFIKEKSIVKTNKLTDVWSHAEIPKADLANEGGVYFSRGKKPEQLLKRIIDMTTQEGDLVLDFFSGSGTTPAVAHKMNRQWIAIEQMDYITDLPELRLKNVVAGDKTGISKAVEWQGGGSFVYCELMEWNEGIVQRIRHAKTTKDLQTIYHDIKGSSFLRYDVDMKAYETDDFTALELDDQKRALLACLEMNHLYVNIREVDDKEYDVSDEDKRLNKSFYGK